MNAFAIGFSVVVLFGGIALVLWMLQRLISPKSGTPSEDDDDTADYARLHRVREAWPEDPIALRRPDPGEAAVVVMEDVHGPVDLLREHLECRGIPADVLDAPVIGRSKHSDIYGTRKLVVWEEDVSRAKEIINWLLEPMELKSEACGESLASKSDCSETAT